MEAIINNGLIPPAWDYQSFYPPGRPFPIQLGWEYTLIMIYLVMKTIFGATLLQSQLWANIIVAWAGAIVAFLLGKRITNNWGGLATALFAVMSPVYISVSQAGYIDSDNIVVFFSLFVALAILYALEKRTKKSILAASGAMALWTFYWQACWYIFLIFLVFIPFYAFFLFLKTYRKKEMMQPKHDWNTLAKKEREIAKKEWEKTQIKPKMDLSFLKEIKSILIVLALIFVIVTICNLIPFTRTIPIWNSLSESLGFIQKIMIVNVSVAELQSLGNIFTWDGMNLIFQRIGYSFYLSMIGFVAVFLYMLRKKDVRLSFVLIGVWLAATFYMLTLGFRFALLFSIPSAIAAGAFIGYIVENIPKMRLSLSSMLLGISLIALILSVLMVQNFKSGLDISQSWIDAMSWLKTNADKNSLLVTWWDPGHILAHETGLKTLNDGAHCGIGCYPYNHNDRISDVGRMMSSSSENETISLLRKYARMTEEEKILSSDEYDANGFNLPDDAFQNVTEIYFISSSDLIFKFQWMSYFGGYGHIPRVLSEGMLEPGQCSAVDTWVWCPWISSMSNMGEDWVEYDFQGVKFKVMSMNSSLIPTYQDIYIIDNIVMETSGELIVYDYTNYDTPMKHLKGMLFVSGQNAVYFAPEIMNSVFTKTFFLKGAGLPHFHIVFSNSELKIYKVDLDG